MKFQVALIIVLVSAAGYFAADVLQKEKGEDLPKGNALAKFDLIQTTSPQSNSLIRTPVVVQGKARGFWFFEAVFPVKVVDANGNLLGQAPAHALSDWMTEEFVNFEASVRFQQSQTEYGFIILERDNPSGLPENANELRIPVRFQEQ